MTQKYQDNGKWMSKSRFPGWYYALFVAALIFGCAEGESEFLNPTSNRALDELPQDVGPFVPAADRTDRVVLQTGSSDRLLLANQTEVQSTVYMKFDVSGFDTTVTSASMSLSFLDLGDGVKIEIYAVDPTTEDWNENELPAEGLPLEAEPFVVLTNTIVGGTTDEPVRERGIDFGVGRGLELVESWRIDPESNRGIAIRNRKDSPGQIHLLSSEFDPDTDGQVGDDPITNQPELLVNLGSAYTPSDDAYRVIDSSPLAPGDAPTLRIEQQHPRRALISFDLVAAGFLHGDLINRAELFVTVVPGSVAEGDSFAVVLRENTSEWTEAASDSISLSSTAMDLEGVNDSTTVLRFDLGQAVQRWIDATNNGMSIHVFDEGEEQSALEIYSRESGDSLAPKLEVLFSAPQGPRWADRPRIGRP